MSLIESQIRVFQDEALEDQWKVDHTNAMVIFHFQDFLKFGLTIYDNMMEIDQRWRTLLRKKEIEYDKEVHRSMYTMIAAWLEPCGKIENCIEALRADGYDIDHADDFQRVHKLVVDLVEEAREDGWYDWPPSGFNDQEIRQDCQETHPTLKQPRAPRRY